LELPGSLIFFVGIPLCSVVDVFEGVFVETDEAAEDAADPALSDGATEAPLDLAKYLFTKLSLSSRNLRYLAVMLEVIS
jgi:hypothetical protein